jgi:hypothetical protein
VRTRDAALTTVILALSTVAQAAKKTAHVGRGDGANAHLDRRVAPKIWLYWVAGQPQTLSAIVLYAPVTSPCETPRAQLHIALFRQMSRHVMVHGDRIAIRGPLALRARCRACRGGRLPDHAPRCAMVDSVLRPSTRLRVRDFESRVGVRPVPATRSRPSAPQALPQRAQATWTC